MQGFGDYHRKKIVATENRIYQTLDYYSYLGKRLSIRMIHKITRIEMKTLRKTLIRMTKEKVLEEVTWLMGWNSKKYCLWKLRDHVEFMELIKGQDMDQALMQYSFMYKRSPEGNIVKI